MPVQRNATSFVVRPAHPGDGPGIAAIARDNAQPDLMSGVDGTYTAHLRDRGTLLVAEEDGWILGYGATIAIGATSLLTDLFVDPARQGIGVGHALLGALWPAEQGNPARFTFASQDPRALHLYVRAGLTPRWPLLYLQGRPTALSASALDAARVTAREAAHAEAGLTGTSREADVYVLSNGDPAGGLVITRDGRVIAAGAVAPGSLSHLACPDPSVAADAVVAGLQALGGGAAMVCLPGPHPAVARLLTAGYRITDFDLYMATEPELLDASWVYSPSLA